MKCELCEGDGVINADGTYTTCLLCGGTGIDMTGRKLAEQHADWLFDLLRKIYVEAFEHGYKHGREKR